MNEKQYKEYVILGKKELQQIEGHQKRICKYAMEVITIRHGGISKGIYTIKKYADDIGMNPKTLQNWLQVYNNVIVKLEEPEKADFQKASKVNNILDEESVIDNAVNGKVHTRDGYKKKKNVPAEKVQKLYNQYHEGKPFEGEFMNIVQQAKSHKLLLEKRDLNIIQDSQLDHLLTTMQCSVDILKMHLTRKRRNMGRTG